MLKGSDATLIQTLNGLNIKHHFFLLYHEKIDPRQRSTFRVLSKVIVDGIDETELLSRSFRYIAARKSSFLVWDQDPEELDKNTTEWGRMQTPWYYEYRTEKEAFKSMDVEWVTEPKEEFLDRDVFLAYGNEAGLDFCYHQLCVVAIIPQAEGQVAAVEVPDGGPIDEEEEKGMRY